MTTSFSQRLAQGAVLSAVIAAGVAAVQLLPSHAAFAADDVAAGVHGDRHERHAAMMHDHLQRVLADAGVAQAQRDRIDAILKQSMEDQHADMERLHADLKLMKELLTAPTINVAKFNTVRAEQDQLALQTSRRLSDTALAVAQQLTPQQRQALGDEFDRMLSRHHGGPGPHGDRRQGDGGRGDGPGRE